MANFTKSDLVREISARTSIGKEDAERAVSAMFETIKEKAEAGQTVTINGFGRFSMKERAGHMGRNPRTGEPIEIAASRTLAFKAPKPRD